MEEEIIIPEEEVFDYHKLRYILDSEGYIFDVSFGAVIECSLGTCTEYTGDIPEGYETIEEWHDEEIERLNAWKVVEGNLVFDTVKYENLKLQHEEEERKNKNATVEYVDESIKNSFNISSLEGMLPSEIAKGTILSIVNANNNKVKYMDIHKTDAGSIQTGFKIFVQGKNLLVNEAINTVNNGIEYTVNNNKSITLNGKATDDSELNICGTSTSKDVLFILKKGIKYYLNCGQTLTLYSYDGTDRTQIYQGTEGIIELEEDALITQVTLNVSRQTSLKNVTVYPQIEVGERYTEYEKAIDKKTFYIDLGDNTLNKIGLFPSNTLYPSDDLYLIDNVEDHLIMEEEQYQLYKNVGYGETQEEIYLDMDEAPILNFGNNTIYADKDLFLEIEYIRNSYYDIAEGTHILHLENTYESKGAVNRLEITGFNGTEKNIELISSIDRSQENSTILLELSEKIGKDAKVVFEDGTATVIRADESTETFENAFIETFDNDTYIYIKGSNNLSYKANYMLKSTFTNYFCTRAEKNASIKITEDEINLEVRKKVGNDEIISKINQTAEEVTIDANKLNINGVISANGNFAVDTNGNMTCKSASMEDANINGGSIILNAESYNSKIKIIDPSRGRILYIGPNYLEIQRTSGDTAINMGINTLGQAHFSLENTSIWENGIWTPQITINGEGTVMYGKGEGHKYRCHWTGSQLQFWVDETNVGTLSDKRLKTEIQDIDEDFINAIKEVEMKQFKVANRNGLVSFGILAQDLIEIFEKYNKNPFDYEIVQETEYRTDDDTIYYTINYEQYLILMTKAQEEEIKQLQVKEQEKDNLIQSLIERIERLEEANGQN